jgi:hypothetical protein
MGEIWEDEGEQNLSQNLKIRDHLVDLGLAGKILKYILWT